MKLEENAALDAVGKVEQLNENQVKQVWSRCLAIIKDNINQQTFKTWFESTVPLKLEDNKLTIRVPSQFFYEWLEEHYYSLINRTLAEVIGENARLVYSVLVEDGPDELTRHAITIPSAKQVLGPPPTYHKDSLPPATSPTPAALAGRATGSFLNARYTFENFIKGDSNQLARAAAVAVANNPGGTSFNPLVIYGGVGLGKTHLIQAIGSHALNHQRADKVFYVSSEKFTIEFVDAIQSDRISEFSSFYRSINLLIVDDIQFFAGKEKTQEIFFHTFNTLHQFGKQIVLSCDRSPKELKGLDERLVSRFQWGLTADIQPPELETRIAILQKKAEDDGVELPQDVIEFIATHVTSNIRELEGCLIGLLAHASLKNEEITLDLARHVVKTVVGDIRAHVTIEDIQRTVSEYFGTPEDLIRAKTRKQEVVIARQIAMYIAKELTNSSLKTIGLHFGGRDHSTVIHAYQSVEDLMKTDERYSRTVQDIKKRLQLYH
ncbi:MAG: chromosomal replication initiator protein DnaA [Bacteroidota bacterium]